MSARNRELAARVAAALTAVAGVLVAWNWRLAPDRWPAWAAALGVVAACAGALVAAWRRRVAGDGRPAAELVAGVGWGAAILAIALAASLVGRRVIPADLAWRVLMAFIGIFFVVTGNAIPKRLTPLDSLACDPRVAQRMQRFAGWTWVLAGALLALAWVALPSAGALAATFVLLPCAILAVAAQWLRLRRLGATPPAAGGHP